MSEPVLEELSRPRINWKALALSMSRLGGRFEIVASKAKAAESEAALEKKKRRDLQTEVLYLRGELTPLGAMGESLA